MHISEASTRPPRWTRMLLDLALPCGPMRDAILGDLHEEFAHDARDMDLRRANARHLRRCADIVTRALLDAAICRNWVSSAPVTETLREAGEVKATPRRAPAMIGDAGFAAVALFVLLVGVVGNTLLFSATETQGARVSSAAGIGGVALFVASVVVAATVMCVGPRWRRKRLTMTSRLSS